MNNVISALLKYWVLIGLFYGPIAFVLIGFLLDNPEALSLRELLFTGKLGVFNSILLPICFTLAVYGLSLPIKDIMGVDSQLNIYERTRRWFIGEQ